MHTVITQPDPAPPRSGARAAPIVAGSVLAVIAVIIGGLGALALWADSRQDERGYLSTGTERYAAGGHAIVTDGLDIDEVPGWLADGGDFGRLRLDVTGAGERPVFVGVARTADVDAYLGGTDHATLTDVDYSPFRPEYRDHDGRRSPAPPASRDIWATSAHGPGTQSLTWDLQDGRWSIVVMNADGSAGVDAAVRAGVRAPWLAAAGYSALGGGLLLLAAAGGLLYLGVRKR